MQERDGRVMTLRCVGMEITTVRCTYTLWTKSSRDMQMDPHVSLCLVLLTGGLEVPQDCRKTRKGARPSVLACFGRAFSSYTPST